MSEVCLLMGGDAESKCGSLTVTSVLLLTHFPFGWCVFFLLVFCNMNCYPTPRRFLMKFGRIVAVCTSVQPGIPKVPQPFVRLGNYGLVNDFHCTPMRRSFSKPGTMVTNNDRHITIVAKEVVDEINRELGVNVPIGGLGENILVEGLGDLSYVKGENVCIGIGNVILGGYNIALRFVKQNQPCKNLAPYHPEYVKKIYGRRGLLCVIESGVGRTIEPGASIRLFNGLA